MKLICFVKMPFLMFFILALKLGKRVNFSFNSFCHFLLVFTDLATIRSVVLPTFLALILLSAGREEDES